MKMLVPLKGLDQFATSFWRYVKDAKVFAFHGVMGSGKTTTIEVLLLAKGVKERMGSPTYSIINEYAYSEDGKERTVFHIDLYRLKDEEEIIQAGVEDCLYSGSLCMVEWPEKSLSLFPDSTVHVFLEPVSAEVRNINIQLPPASLEEQS